MDRRSFLIGGLVAGGAGAGLLVGCGPLLGDRVGEPESWDAPAGSVGLNAWVRVNADSTVNLAMAHVEMGQGISTALPMIVAEELDLPLAMVRTDPAGPERIYGNQVVFGASWWFHPDDEQSALARSFLEMGRMTGAVLGVQITGGSSSVRDAYETLRRASAGARAMLVAAAAQRWNVAVSECTTAGGAVLHRHAGRLGYGALALEASRMGVLAEARPKDAAQRRLVGTNPQRLDSASKVDGSAIYAADVRLPGMLFAAIRGCPVPGGSLERLDDTAARAMAGVIKVLRYEGAAGCAPGVGVVARDSWQAQLGVAACKINWNEGARKAFGSAQLLDDMRKAFDGADAGFVFHERGMGARALDSAARAMHADYAAPWLAHATMEPMNCTAQFVDGRLKLWVPTQAPTFARDTAARVSALASAQIDLQVTQLGGGFGRRLETDYLVPAIALARAVAPAAVQVQWSREEDMSHDFYRPAAVCRLQAGLDAQGRLLAWVTRSASDALVAQFLGRNFPAMAKAMAMVPDRTQSEGLWDQAYEIPNRKCAHVTVPSPVPIGNWRGVGHSHMAFFTESFIDEVAHAVGADPLSYRMAMLREHPRHSRVLELAAAKANWGLPLPAGRALGLALHESYGSVVAQVAEVSVEGGQIRVHRVVCAVDCGTVIHPDGVAQQIEGGVIFALSAARFGEISFRDSRVEQSNFPDYEMVRMRDAPQVQTWIVPSDAPPTGVGEVAVPPLAPAVANAVFALTGKRLRSLPLRLG